MRRALPGWGLRIIRDRVLRFNAEGPEGLKDRKASGPPRKLNAKQRTALAAVAGSCPNPATHGVVRWRRSKKRPGTAEVEARVRQQNKMSAAI